MSARKSPTNEEERAIEDRLRRVSGGFETLAAAADGEEPLFELTPMMRRLRDEGGETEN